jgi:membrane protein required for colicin V production
MNWLDYALIGLLAVSIAWGIWRGLVHEVMSLAGWVLAFVAANVFTAPLAELLPDSVSQPEVRMLIAFILVFLGTLIAATVVTVLLARLVKTSGLVSLDRTLGAVFGAARALVIVLAFALLAGLTALPQKPWWKASASGVPLASAAFALRPWLPPAFAARLRYH